MAVDISGISYFAPLFAFLIVFVIVYAVLARTKLLGDEVSPWILLFISFVIASVFVSAAGVRDYVLTITPWFGALIISLFFLIVMLRFIGKDVAFMEKGVGIIAVIVLFIVFLISGFIVFSEFLIPFLPGGTSSGFLSGVYNTRVFGAVLLLVLCGIVSWVLTRKMKKE